MVQFEPSSGLNEPEVVQFEPISGSSDLKWFVQFEPSSGSSEPELVQFGPSSGSNFDWLFWLRKSRDRGFCVT